MLEQSKVEQLLSQSLAPLEKERIQLHQSLKRETTIAKVLLAVLLLPNLYCLTSFQGNNLYIALGVSVTLTYLCYSVGVKWLKKRQDELKDTFEQKVKQQVYQNVFTTWNNTAIYKPKEHIKEEDFRKAGLHWGFTSYEGEDYCEGKLNDGRHFQFSEVDTIKTIEERDEYGVSFHHFPVFKGLFFILDNTLPYASFNGQVKIAPILPEEDEKPSKAPTKKTTSLYDDVLDANFSDDVPSQQYDSSKLLFDQSYTVSDEEGQNPLIRKQLPELFTQQLTYFKSFYAQDFSIYFDNNKAYFASRHQADFLPVPIADSLVSEIVIRNLARNFTRVFMLLEKIEAVTLTDRT